MNPKYQKVLSDIGKAEKKKSEIEGQLKELYDKKTELENLEIINTVRSIDDMKSVTLNDMDGEIAELMYKTVRKLEAMTDAEFEELYIMPDGMVDD